MGDVDADLVAALRRHDPDSAEQLVERYGDRAYRVALSITRVEGDAAEVVADALRTVASTIDTFMGEPTFGSWIYRTVTHAAYETLHKRGQHVDEMALGDVVPSLDGEGRHFEPITDWSKRIDELALQGAVRGVLSEAIDALPPDYRAALILHDVEGASKPDLAEILGVDEAVAKLRLHRARLFVRKRLSEYFES